MAFEFRHLGLDQALESSHASFFRERLGAKAALSATASRLSAEFCIGFDLQFRSCKHAGRF
jgi:hypothetical protein